MKRLIIITVIILTHYIGISQTAPVWTKKLPDPSNNTFYYCSITGFGSNYNEALNDAYNKLHRVIDEKLGTTMIGKSSMDNQGSVSYYAVDGQTHTIQTFKRCDWPKPHEKSDHWEFLFQVAEAGNITVYFDDFNDCYKMVTDHSEDWKAFRMSFFPGLGHIYKNHKALGYTIMVSDIALVCGGIGCYFAAQTYSDIMDDPTATASEKRDAESTYNMLNSASIVCYSAAAVLYIVNLWTAYTISDNRNTRVSFHPVISPNNKDIAFGIGASFKF